MRARMRGDRVQASPHIFGTCGPVEEPSTASTAAVSKCGKECSYSITSTGGKQRWRHVEADRFSSVDHIHGGMRSRRSVARNARARLAGDAGECGVVKRPRNRFMLTFSAAVVRLD